jgi:hypothetical protein
MSWPLLNLTFIERTLIKLKSLGFQTIVNINFPSELCFVLSRGLFHSVGSQMDS